MKKFLSALVLIMFILTLLTYGSVLISPQVLRLSGFFSLLIPFFIILNLLFGFILLFKGATRLALLPVFTLIIGYKFILVTFPFSSERNDQGHFSILSYNVKWFVESDEGGGFDSAMKWLKTDDSDIKCFQEFHSRKDIIKAIGNNGEYYLARGGRGNTLAIFSKYRIINSGVLFPEDNINNALFVDLLMNQDTIRIYNVHLRSMGINLNEVSTQEEVRHEYDKVKNKFLNGSVQRAEQIGKLLEHAGDCKYPIIISGDFNDVPYSYNYFKIKQTFNNAFEIAGKGLGFTFRGGLPFLRIDNQFYNDKITTHKFETLNDIRYSDHFPIKGRYSILE